MKEGYKILFKNFVLSPPQQIRPLPYRNMGEHMANYTSWKAHQVYRVHTEGD
jgi:hypothetical protein